MSEEDQDEWDPVQDVFGYERDNYVDLIRYFLMTKDQEDTLEEEMPDLIPLHDNSNNNAAAGTPTPEPSDKPLSKSAKKRAKKANADEKKLAGPSRLDADGKESRSIEMESKKQMRERLRRPVKYQRPSGWYMADSESKAYIDPQCPPVPDDEIEQLLDEVAEVKHFLFCRLLLSHASLLPIALQADSVEQFLANDQVTQEHLRDLALNLERPRLQDVRDACADFIRGEENGDAEDDEPSANEVEKKSETKKKPGKYDFKFRGKPRMPEKYQTKREKERDKKPFPTKDLFGPDEGEGILDFGKVTNESDYEGGKMRIKIWYVVLGFYFSSPLNCPATCMAC